MSYILTITMLCAGNLILAYAFKDLKKDYWKLHKRIDDLEDLIRERNDHRKYSNTRY